MKILFVLHSELDSNSGYHVDIYARHLAAMGHQAMVAYAGLPVPVDHLDYRAATHLDLYRDTRQHLEFVRPDIIVAWSPREIVRIVVEKVRTEVPKAKLIIHYEDNEELLTETFLPEIIASRSNLQFYDPERGRHFVDSADGFTFVVSTLEAIVPVNGRPFATLGAPYDDRLFRPRPRNHDWRKAHGIPNDQLVIVYPGNVHLANRRDVEMLYEAVALLSRSRKITLVRTGHVSLDGITPENVRDLGHVDRKQMPEILAAADLFIQPGRPGPFDNYRFPSKIPEMAITGRPLICPPLPCLSTFSNREEVFKCSMDNPDAMGDAVIGLLSRTGMREKLSKGAIRAANRECAPATASVRLAEFLREVAEPGG